MKHTIWIVLIIILGSCSKEPESDCTSGTMDGTETGIDCGGICTPCPTCTDGIKNQDEVKVDCGGSCSPCSIEYPTSGTYGLNILHGSDSLFLSGNDNFSLRAIVPEGSTLKIEFHSIYGDVWGHAASTNVGWSISTYNSGFQFFEAINFGTTDLKVIKWPGSGTGGILVKYFENSTFETKRKILIWQ